MGLGWLGSVERSLVDALIPSSDASAPPVSPDGALVVCAERHGLLALVEQTWPGVLNASAAREVARQLEHDAHLALLLRLDGALAAAGVDAVLLKGVGLSERLYERPCLRPTSDVDLLVREQELTTARDALLEAGYRWEDSATEARYRREHHHLHLYKEGSLPLELHFHAYRGFGRVLRSEPLLDRSRSFADPAGRRTSTWRALRFLAPSDEFVYLAVHAAAHRFVRLGWLYDLALLVATMSDDELSVAASRARETGFARATALAVDLLTDVFGASSSRLPAPIGLSAARRTLVRSVLREPRSPVLKSASRFVFTVSLCDTPMAALRYARRGVRDHAQQLLGARATR